MISVEVARNLGKTLRAFQPTIKELREVSREFKSTLEREIGLDEFQISNQNTNSPTTTKTTSSPSPNSSSEGSQMEIDPNGSSSPSKAYLKKTEEQLRAASVAQQQTESMSPGESPSEVQTESQDISQVAAPAMPSPEKTENEK